ncbi:hypothetical protein D3C86_1692050 [compost metagenome]
MHRVMLRTQILVTPELNQQKPYPVYKSFPEDLWISAPQQNQSSVAQEPPFFHHQLQKHVFLFHVGNPTKQTDRFPSPEHPPG